MNNKFKSIGFFTMIFACVMISGCATSNNSEVEKATKEDETRAETGEIILTLDNWSDYIELREVEEESYYNSGEIIEPTEDVLKVVQNDGWYTVALVLCPKNEQIVLNKIELQGTISGTECNDYIDITNGESVEGYPQIEDIQSEVFHIYYLPVDRVPIRRTQYYSCSNVGGEFLYQSVFGMTSIEITEINGTVTVE